MLELIQNNMMFTVFSLLILGLIQKEISAYTTCAFYDIKACHRPGVICNKTIECTKAKKRSACFAAWMNSSSGQKTVVQQDCWYGKTCNAGQKCTAHDYSKSDGRTPYTYFCCCNGDYCNQNFTYANNIKERNLKLPLSIPATHRHTLVAGESTPNKPTLAKYLLCDSYDHKTCRRDSTKCNGTIKCPVNGTDSTTVACFAAWRNDTVLRVEKKGCWPSGKFCGSNKTCKSTRSSKMFNRSVHFCCCHGDLCNQNFSFSKPPLDISPDTPVIEALTPSKHQLYNALCYSLVPVGAIAIIVISLFCIWRRHSKYRQQVLTHDPDPIPDSKTVLLGCPGEVELIEMKAYGRFGAVWKAMLNKKPVAVKIFPLQDKQSWAMERDIYSIPHLKHDNILQFIAVDCKQTHLTTEFWLVTEFHEKGSLYDFLKCHTVSWSELCSLCESMLHGLAYLHDDISPTGGSVGKVSIAHRDFKSKNVLIKNNMMACIADFGLAMKFDMNKGIGDTHTQVGTRRYMAPEVLEGAIVFSRDSFLRIDMYACALVLWEIMSRCSVVNDVSDYQLPFENTAGLHPTLEEMEDLVVCKKSRPSFKESWLSHPGLRLLCTTVEECWDHDGEGRLSAQCVEVRLARISSQLNVSDTSSDDIPATKDGVPPDAIIGLSHLGDSFGTERPG